MYLSDSGMLESDSDPTTRRSRISDAADLAAKVGSSISRQLLVLAPTLIAV